MTVLHRYGSDKRLGSSLFPNLHGGFTSIGASNEIFMEQADDWTKAASGDLRVCDVLRGCDPAQTTIQRQDISLNSGWEFRQLGAADNSAEWRPAQVPGDVHLDLLRNKLIPDPFYRDNEAKLQWIENADWEYRTTFRRRPICSSHKNIELVFEASTPTPRSI